MATTACPFCVVASGFDSPDVESKQSDVFYRDDDVIAFISAGWWPNNPGSVLIIPVRHYRDIYDIPENAYAAVNEFGRRLATTMKQEYKCDGISFRQHNEPAGGQSVNHYHLWVFARFKGDRLYESYSEGAIVSVEDRSRYARRLEKYFQGSR
jgi:histidine triad (HIT) family protein